MPPVEVAECSVSDWVKRTGRAFEVRRDKDVASSRPTKETWSEGTRRATPRESTFRPFWCIKRVTPPVGAALPAGREISGTEHCGTRHLKNGARYLGRQIPTPKLDARAVHLFCRVGGERRGVWRRMRHKAIGAGRPVEPPAKAHWTRGDPKGKTAGQRGCWGQRPRRPLRQAMPLPGRQAGRQAERC